MKNYSVKAWILGCVLTAVVVGSNDVFCSAMIRGDVAVNQPGIIELSDANFQENVLDHKEKVLVDFWAPWCGPCRTLMPILEEISQELTDVRICKINVDEHTEIASRYEVMSLPTLILFQDGKPVDSMVGSRGKDELLAWIKR